MIVHSYIQTEGGMGLGDFLRGSLALHQVCYATRTPFAITFKDHPISKFIVGDTQTIPDISIHNLNNKCIKIPQLRNEIQTIKGNRKLSVANIGLHCNTFPRFPIHNITKRFMIDSFTPNESLASDIQTAKPIEDYEVIHIRAGDMIAYNTAINFTVDYDYEKIIQRIVSKVNEIKSQSANAFIIMCDSDKVKKTLAKKCGLIPTKAKSVHLNIAKESDSDRVKDTLVDFFLLKDAKAVHQFSVHGWGSTFSNCANWIYDTPLNQYTLLT
jgi:hypothetical protein